MEQEIFNVVKSSENPLGEAARRGAQLIIQKAIEMEVTDFLGRERYERTAAGAGRGSRNGYERKKLHTGEGTIEVHAPQVRGNLEPFESVWLRSIGKRSKRLMELVPMMYVKGMSQRDIEDALVEALGVEQMGRTVVNEVCKSLRGNFEKWQNRDLSEQEVMYMFFDGIYLKLRPEDKRSVAVLCAYGMLWNGRKVLLHLALGDKESTACWEAFIEDMKQRGLPDPLLCVVDGCAGVRKAISRKYRNSLVQRCQVHKMRNIMNKLPHVARAQMHKLIQRAFTAARHEEGLAQARAIISQYKDAYPAAMQCLERDLEECLTALKLPFAHRVQIRTTNLLERLFGEGKRRTKIIPRFTSEAGGLSLVFAVLVDASEGWRGVRMKPYIEERLKQMIVDPESKWEDPDLKKIAA
jgi:transposase-like protein